MNFFTLCKINQTWRFLLTGIKNKGVEIVEIKKTVSMVGSICCILIFKNILVMDFSRDNGAGNEVFRSWRNQHVCGGKMFFFIFTGKDALFIFYLMSGYYTSSRESWRQNVFYLCQWQGEVFAGFFWANYLTVFVFFVNRKILLQK